MENLWDRFEGELKNLDEKLYQEDFVTEEDLIKKQKQIEWFIRNISAPQDIQDKYIKLLRNQIEEIQQHKQDELWRSKEKYEKMINDIEQRLEDFITEYVLHLIERWESLSSLSRDYYWDWNLYPRLINMWYRQDIQAWTMILLPKQLWDREIKPEYRHLNPFIQIERFERWESMVYEDWENLKQPDSWEVINDTPTTPISDVDLWDSQTDKTPVKDVIPDISKIDIWWVSVLDSLNSNAEFLIRFAEQNNIVTDIRYPFAEIKNPDSPSCPRPDLVKRMDLDTKQLAFDFEKRAENNQTAQEYRSAYFRKKTIGVFEQMWVRYKMDKSVNWLIATQLVDYMLWRIKSPETDNWWIMISNNAKEDILENRLKHWENKHITTFLEWLYDYWVKERLMDRWWITESEKDMMNRLFLMYVDFDWLEEKRQEYNKKVGAWEIKWWNFNEDFMELLIYEFQRNSGQLEVTWTQWVVNFIMLVNNTINSKWFFDNIQGIKDKGKEVWDMIDKYWLEKERRQNLDKLFDKWVEEWYIKDWKINIDWLTPQEADKVMVDIINNLWVDSLERKRYETARQILNNGNIPLEDKQTMLNDLLVIKSYDITDSVLKKNPWNTEDIKKSVEELKQLELNNMFLGQFNVIISWELREFGIFEEHIDKLQSLLNKHKQSWNINDLWKQVSSLLWEIFETQFQLSSSVDVEWNFLISGQQETITQKTSAMIDKFNQINSTNSWYNEKRYQILNEIRWLNFMSMWLIEDTANVEDKRFTFRDILVSKYHWEYREFLQDKPTQQRIDAELEVSRKEMQDAISNLNLIKEQVNNTLKEQWLWDKFSEDDVMKIISDKMWDILWMLLMRKRVDVEDKYFLERLDKKDWMVNDYNTLFNWMIDVDALKTSKEKVSEIVQIAIVYLLTKWIVEWASQLFVRMWWPELAGLRYWEWIKVAKDFTAWWISFDFYWHMVWWEWGIQDRLSSYWEYVWSREFAETWFGSWLMFMLVKWKWRLEWNSLVEKAWNWIKEFSKDLVWFTMISEAVKSGLYDNYWFWDNLQERFVENWMLLVWMLVWRWAEIWMKWLSPNQITQVENIRKPEWKSTPPPEWHLISWGRLRLDILLDKLVDWKNLKEVKDWELNQERVSKAMKEDLLAYLRENKIDVDKIPNLDSMITRLTNEYLVVRKARIETKWEENLFKEKVSKLLWFEVREFNSKVGEMLVDKLKLFNYENDWN